MAVTTNVRGERAGAASEAKAHLLDGLPLRERRLELAGASTAVLEGGEGPPIVLLHGGIESGGVYWAPVVSRLAVENRVVIPDLPGLGSSEPWTRLDPEVFSAWLTQLIGATCGTAPALVAHSLTGSLVARFAARNGELLDRLVIYGAPGIGRYRLPVGLLVAAIRSDLRPTERNLERFLPWPFLDHEAVRDRDPVWFRAFLAYMLDRGRVPHVKRTMRRLIGLGTRQVPDHEMQRIEAPTALVWGRHDRMAPLGLGERAARELGWRLRVVEDSGHVPHLERPGDFLRSLHHALDSGEVRPAR